MKKIARELIIFFFIGCSAMLGIRAIEWVVPAKPQEVLICFVGYTHKIDACSTIKKLVEAQKND